MKPILFKAKALQSGNWVKGLPLKTDMSSRGAFIRQRNFTDDSFDDIKVDRDTLSEYTGCDDDYDNKIFEGDIVEYSDLKGVKFTGTIVFENGSFGIGTDEAIPLDYTRSDNFISLSDIAWFNADIIYDDIFTCLKIIGNIHNNPQIEQNESVKEIEEK